MSELLILFLALWASVDELNRHPDPGAAFSERWQWAESRLEDEHRINIGYEVTLTLPEGVWLGGYFRVWGVGPRDRSLQARLDGLETPRLIAQRMAVVAVYESEWLRDLWLVRLDAPLEIRGPLYWLGATTNEESRDHLIALFPKHRMASAATDIVSAIGFHEGREIGSFLLGLIDSDVSREVRGEAVESLALLPENAVVARLIQLALSEPDLEVRLEAIETLGSRAEASAKKTLLDLTRSSEPIAVREQALEALGDHVDDGVVKRSRQILAETKYEDLAEKALYLLSGQPNAFAIMEEAAKKHRFHDVREQAMMIMTELNAARALPIIENVALREKDGEIAEMAVSALGEFPSEKAVPTLFRVLDGNDHPDVLETTIHLLSEYPEPRVVERIEKLAWQEKDTDIAEAAIWALADMQFQGVRKTLLALAKNHPREDVRDHAREVLEELVFGH